jgi:hypothetical protein
MSPTGQTPEGCGVLASLHLRPLTSAGFTGELELCDAPLGLFVNPHVAVVSTSNAGFLDLSSYGHRDHSGELSGIFFFEEFCSSPEVQEKFSWFR